MKIGEFAKLCSTRISVLRHYDKEKLLVPEYTDAFSGYRYYSSEQLLVFRRITALKKAGFSLQEIRALISSAKTKEETAEMFCRKENELLSALENLKEARLIMTKLNITFKNGKAVFALNPDEELLSICSLAEAEIKAADYQRVSQYSVSGNEVRCDVIALGEETDLPDLNLPFENDEEVIGKWEILGVYAVKQDFYDGILCDNKGFYGGEQKYLYFLPDGEQYWAYSWTKGYLISPVYNEYETQKIGDELYMFVSLREYECTRGGRPTCLVLKKLDSNRYTPEQIARKDDIDKPFVNDEQVIGKWRAHSFLGYKGGKSEFPSDEEPIEDLYFKEVEFFEGGHCRLVYEDDVFEGDDKAVWTKNYLLRKWNWSACEYEIRTHNSKEYLIIEWKSGDYRYGGYDTNYYVFVRA